MDQFLFVNIG